MFSVAVGKLSKAPFLKSDNIIRYIYSRENEAKHHGSKGDITARIEADTKVKIEAMNRSVAANKEQVIFKQLFYITNCSYIWLVIDDNSYEILFWTWLLCLYPIEDTEGGNILLFIWDHNEFDLLDLQGWHCMIHSLTQNWLCKFLGIFCLN